jgi:hypothetical protein
MINRTSIAGIVLAALTMAALTMIVFGAQAHDETKYPDWSGQWDRVPNPDPPRYDPSKPIRAQQAPLKEEYRLRHEASSVIRMRADSVSTSTTPASRKPCRG